MIPSGKRKLSFLGIHVFPVSINELKTLEPNLERSEVSEFTEPV